MAVDRPDVHDVARRKVAHRTPFGKQPAPQTGSVQRLDRGHRRRACGQHDQQVFERLPGPRRTQFRRGLGEAGQRGRRHRQPGGGRGGRNPQDQAGITFGAGVAGEDHLAGEFDDALVERTARGPSERRESTSGQRVAGGANAGVDVEADGAGGVGKHAGQVESVADLQCGADLVGVLGEQQFAAAPGDPVQFGAHIEQCHVRLAQCLGGRRQTIGWDRHRRAGRSPAR